MEKSDAYRFLKEHVKFAKEKDGRQIYNIVWQEERQEAEQDIRVFSFGRPYPANPPLRTVCVMLHEERGAGKSTFINTVLNYLFGVKFEDLIRLEVEEKIEDGGLETDNRTDVKTVYTVHYQEGMKHKCNFVLLVTREQDLHQEIEQCTQFFISYFGVENLISLGVITKYNEKIINDFQKNLPEVSATPTQDTKSFNVVVTYCDTTFRIIFNFDNGCHLCPKETDAEYRNQWKRVTEQYDTFFNALSEEPSVSFGNMDEKEEELEIDFGNMDEKEEELEIDCHEHYCNKCKKICWTCHKKNCSSKHMHVAMAVGTTMAIFTPLIALVGFSKGKPIPTIAASLGTGFCGHLVTSLIGFITNKCKGSQCNHPLSQHVKKQGKRTERTQGDKISDEDRKKKRMKLSE